MEDLLAKVLEEKVAVWYDAANGDAKERLQQEKAKGREKRRPSLFRGAREFILFEVSGTVLKEKELREPTT
jgi:hypothetical protein